VLVFAALAAGLSLGGCVTDNKPASELPATAQTAAKPDDKKPDDKKPDDNARPDNRSDKKPDTKPAPAAESDPGPPLERHEVAGTCWMIADKRGGSLDAKLKTVDKCIDDRMKADAAKRAGAPSR
jgi:hypothetical protein